MTGTKPGFPHNPRAKGRNFLVHYALRREPFPAVSLMTYRFFPQGPACLQYARWLALAGGLFIPLVQDLPRSSVITIAGLKAILPCGPQ
jgi:hypothetical protein